MVGVGEGTQGCHALVAENTWVVEYMGGHMAALSDRPPRFMRNQTQLITYVDRLAADLPGLSELLKGPLAGVFGGVHLLPFFHPIDGSDAGFDPIDHTAVDHRLGSWNDPEELEVRTVIRNGSDTHQFSGMDFCR